MDRKNFRSAEDPGERAGFLEGMRVAAGPAGATFVLGITYGAVAQTQGWGIMLPIAASLLLLSSSAQFTLLTVLAGGGGVPAAIAAAILINARYLVMSIAVAPSLRGGRLRRAVEAQTLADASFVVAHEGGGRFHRERLIGATAPQWTAWVTGTVVGVLVAPPQDVMDTFGLDVVFPAFFLVLAMDELRRSRRAALAGALGAGLVAALLFAVSPGMALVLATVAALIGVLPERGRDDAEETGDETAERGTS